MVQLTQEELFAIYKENGQQHVFQHFDALTDEQKEALLDQMREIDLKRLSVMFKQAQETANSTGSVELTPPEKSDSTVLSPPSKVADWIGLGKDAVLEGKVAPLVMAGGQGTRLGFDKPKGMYDVNLPSHRSLFEVHADQIRGLHNNVQAENKDKKVPMVPWVIMTSAATHTETVAFFEEHNYFSLGKENVLFFQQSWLPCVDSDCKIIMNDKATISTAPDGNGSVYRSAQRTGVLAELKKRGVTHVYVYGVDNLLAKPADPALIGYTMDQKAEVGCMVVPKERPDERVGIVCRVDGKSKVVEYSELPKELCEQRDSDGRLTFRAGNIATHVFTLDFMLKSADLEAKNLLSYHIAHKKIPFLGASGETCTPSEPNGFKMELFVFDTFPLADRVALLEGPRALFAPIKNAPGAANDTPESSRAMLYALHAGWMKDAGVTVTGDVEISPMVSYMGENLQGCKQLQGYICK
eukprot:TRINITY_DN9838_c0_g1_i2.p1 TRINITY_DN9838_c0_g1~~TRINITY_DN9838_c0_g1_i2.p1  ORF type:complete len:468 (-),score=116.68 TRINITY_DN9838_c0_g1_i2:28-1431(-)